MTTLTALTSLPLSSLVLVVEHLPTPLVVVDDDGVVVGASPSARALLALPDPPDPFDEIVLERRLARAAPGLTVAAGAPVPCDDGVHRMVALVGTPPPPKDVAALAGAVAHDFNNLLGVIINFTSLAAAGLPPGSPAAADLREVLAASERAATIARRLEELGDVRPHRDLAGPR